jgi:hypothetical protein
MGESDCSGEEFITIREAMRGVKVEAGPQTGMRWATKGLAGPDGQRIRLRTWAIGRKIVTTNAAMREFIDRVTAARDQRLRTKTLRISDEPSLEELKAAGLLENSRSSKKGGQ